MSILIRKGFDKKKWKISSMTQFKDFLQNCRFEKACNIFMRIKILEIGIPYEDPSQWKAILNCFDALFKWPRVGSRKQEAH